MALKTWDFEGADWTDPDARDSRYFNCLVEALKERAAHAGYVPDPTIMAYFDRLPYDTPNLAVSFSFDNYDKILKNIVPYYHDTLPTILEEMLDWLDKNYDLVGDNAYDKATGNVEYVVNGGKVWKVNATSLTTFDLPNHWTWETICKKEIAGIKQAFTDEDLATPPHTGFYIVDNYLIKRWIITRRQIIDALLILWGTESIGVTPSFDWESSTTTDYACEAYYQWWSWWDDGLGGGHWDTAKTCASCGALPDCSTITSDTDTNAVTGAVYVSTAAYQDKVDYFLHIDYYWDAGCGSGLYYKNEWKNETSHKYETTKTIDIYGNGKANVIINELQIDSINGVMQDAVLITSFEFPYDSTRTSAELLTTYEQSVAAPFLEFDPVSLDTGCVPNYGYLGWLISTGHTRDPVTPTSSRGQYLADGHYVSQAQLNADPFNYAYFLINILGKRTALVPESFNFHA